MKSRGNNNLIVLLRRHIIYEILLTVFIKSLDFEILKQCIFSIEIFNNTYYFAKFFRTHHFSYEFFTSFNGA